MKKIKYLVAVGCLFSLSLSMQAEPGKKNKNLMVMDKDRNGVISFSEFSSRSERMFSFLDQNSDGNITRQEMDVSESVKKQKMLSRKADRLDRNDDQKIDQNEFIAGSKGRPPEPRHKPKRRGPPKGPPPEGKKEGREVGPKVAKDLKFQKLDLNSNNRISKEEFISPLQKRFSALDKNSDEVLDRRELMNLSQRKKDDMRKYKDNMWKGKPPTMHRERKRH